MIVGDGDMDRRRVAGRDQRRQPHRRAAGERHGRLAGGEVDDPHLRPRDAHPQPGAERFRAGFLRRPAFRVAGRARPAALGFRLLDLGEDALDEALAEPFQRLFDPPDIGEVGADADDHEAPVVR